MTNGFEGGWQPSQDAPSSVDEWAHDYLTNNDFANEVCLDSETGVLQIYVLPDVDTSEFPEEIDGMSIAYVHAEPPELL